MTCQQNRRKSRICRPIRWICRQFCRHNHMLDVRVFAREGSVAARRPFTSGVMRAAASANDRSVSWTPVRLSTRGGTATSRASSSGATRGVRPRVFSTVVVPCGGVATSQMFPEAFGSTSSVLQPSTSNQAMQLTASKLAVHALRLCHPRSGSVERHLGLAAADLGSR